MGRCVRQTLRVVGGLALVAWWVVQATGSLLWWSPSIALALARLWGGRLRFFAVMAVGDLLKAAGRRGAAERVYLAEARRCRARMAAIRAQWRAP